jgi:predicted DNA-binding ribbon-helix-helix protein
MPSFHISVDSDTFMILYEEAKRRGTSVTRLIADIAREYAKTLKVGAKP